jgi:hypothetical protein
MISKIYNFYTFAWNVCSKLRTLYINENVVKEVKEVKEAKEAKEGKEAKEAKEVVPAIMSDWRKPLPLTFLCKPEYLVKESNSFEDILSCMLLSSNNYHQKTKYIYELENVDNLIQQLSAIIKNEKNKEYLENMNVENVELKTVLDEFLINTNRDFCVEKMKNIIMTSVQLNNIAQMEINFKEMLNSRIHMFQIIHTLCYIFGTSDSFEELSSNNYSNFFKTDPLFIDYASEEHKIERKKCIDQSRAEPYI